MKETKEEMHLRSILDGSVIIKKQKYIKDVCELEFFS